MTKLTPCKMINLLRLYRPTAIRKLRFLFSIRTYNLPIWPYLFGHLEKPLFTTNYYLFKQVQWTSRSRIWGRILIGCFVKLTSLTHFISFVDVPIFERSKIRPILLKICTVNIRIPDKSSFRMVDLCPVDEWSGFQMPFEYWTNVWFLNGSY
jgi:hypothetical protein